MKVASEIHPASSDGRKTVVVDKFLLLPSGIVIFRPHIPVVGQVVDFKEPFQRKTVVVAFHVDVQVCAEIAGKMLLVSLGRYGLEFDFFCNLASSY
jgi:hypothetical protein